MPNRKTLCTIFSVFILIGSIGFVGTSFCQPVYAQDTNVPLDPDSTILDPTFGVGGKVTTPFPAGPGLATAVAIQSDGKIVAGGEVNSPRGSYNSETFGLARYNLDGSPDLSFGTGGKVITPGSSELTSLVIQPDGKIVAAGDAYDPTGATSTFAVARYNADGSLDASFGTAGIVTTSFFGHQDKVNALLLLPDGRLVAVGSANNGSKSVFAEARYNSTGSLDTSFGSGGKMTIDFGSSNEFANAAALQADGKIVAAGYDTTSSNTDFALARLNTDGTLDSSFGTSGKVTTDIALGDQANAVKIQADGKIIAAGYDNFQLDNFGNPASKDCVVVRYNANGSLDTSFGSGGKVTTDFGAFDVFYSLVIQSDNKIVAAGIAADNSPNGNTAVLARYTTSGTLDTSFGTGGKVTTSQPGLSYGSIPSGHGIALQTDGRIIVAGFGNSGFDMEFGILRYTTSGVLDTSFGGRGIVATDFQVIDSSIKSLLLQPDNKIVAVGGIYDFAIPWVSHVYLARYNTDGSLDPAFGNGGRVISDFFADHYTTVVTSALQPDGKILVGGGTSSLTTEDDFTFARYNANGRLDTSFGSSGVVTAHFANNNGDISSILVQPDGKILTAGSTSANSFNSGDFRLLRYNSDGTPDTSFGNNGQVSSPSVGVVGNFYVQGVLQSDGKVVASFHKPNPNNNSGIAYEVIRYNANGSLDTTFGSGGTITVDFTNNSQKQFGEVGQLLERPDGSFYVVGFEFDVTTFAESQYVERFKSDGSVDTTYASNGVATFNIPGFTPGPGIVLQPDGKIVASGYLFFPNSVVSSFAVARFNGDGTLDTFFGSGGSLTTTFFSYPGTGVAFYLSNLATAAIIQPDGNIVVGGGFDSGVSTDFALARYTNSIVTVSGRVLTSMGTGLKNATVTLTNSRGVTARILSSSLGFFSFDNVPTGDTYTLRVTSKRFRFSPRNFAVNDSVTDLVLNGVE